MKLGKIIFQGKTRKGLKILIRYPQADDANRLRSYINTLSLERTFIRFQGEQVSLKEEKEYLKKSLERIKKNLEIKLLVFVEGKLIAVADITPKDKIESHVGVFGISVAKDYRGQGIGKLLTQLLLDEAKRNLKQLRLIELGVFANNPIAYKMYQKFGFIEFGNLPEGIRYKGKYINHLYMYKKIR